MEEPQDFLEIAELPENYDINQGKKFEYEADDLENLLSYLENLKKETYDIYMVLMREKNINNQTMMMNYKDSMSYIEENLEKLYIIYRKEQVLEIKLKEEDKLRKEKALEIRKEYEKKLEEIKKSITSINIIKKK